MTRRLRLHFGKPRSVLCTPLLCILIEDALLAQKSSLRSRVSWEFLLADPAPEAQRPEQDPWGVTGVQMGDGEHGKAPRVAGGPAISGHPAGQSFSPAPGTV